MLALESLLIPLKQKNFNGEEEEEEDDDDDEDDDMKDKNYEIIFVDDNEGTEDDDDDWNLNEPKIKIFLQDWQIRHTGNKEIDFA